MSFLLLQQRLSETDAKTAKILSGSVSDVESEMQTEAVLYVGGKILRERIEKNTCISEESII